MEPTGSVRKTVISNATITYLYAIVSEYADENSHLFNIKTEQ